MAKPKVFISSTCYDFGEVRDSLSSFVNSIGFEPVLSEHGDVFFHPDLHTHDACLHEVGNCQLFVLLIGGRFGGTYVNDADKSVTNAEYEAAVQKKIPVFTYIKRNVLDSHNMYQTNKDKSFAKDINYPSIERQSDSSSIFEFINRVRRASVNNGYEPFDVSKDIETHLRKQWAGMFFDFLKNREVEVQISSTNEAVHEIQNVSNKLEAIITNIYKVVDKDNAEQNIADIQNKSMANEFLEKTIGKWFRNGIKVDKIGKKKLLSVNPSNLNWYEYFETLGIFEIKYYNNDKRDIGLYYFNKIVNAKGFWSETNSLSVCSLKKNKGYDDIKVLYEKGFKSLDKEMRNELLLQFFEEKEFVDADTVTKNILNK